MKVGVKVEHTLSVGNFGTVRPGIYVEDDVVPGEETPEEAYKRVSSIAHKLWYPEFQSHLREHVAAETVIKKAIKKLTSPKE